MEPRDFRVTSTFLRPLSLGQPGTKEFVFKPYPHNGFPEGCFTHSNYEYRQYKGAVAPPEWKPLKHDPFPRDTFTHSNYSYRQGGFMGKRPTPPLQTPTTTAQPTAARDVVTQTPTSKSTAAATPTTFSITSRPQVLALSPTTIATTTSIFPFIRTPGVQLSPELFSSYSPTSVGRATNGTKEPVVDSNDEDTEAKEEEEGDEEGQDELDRPSVLTLRLWEEDGTVSMVQDYRILIRGQLHVGKIQTEW
jgi:hypothetical protein